MMPFALADTISTDMLDGGIEISSQQYDYARAAKLLGREALVLDGALVIRDPAPSPDHIWQDGEWSEPEQPSPEPVDPLTVALTKRQVIAAMILGAGVLDPDGAVTAAISSMTDPVAGALALNDWRNAPYYKRDHPLFNDADLMAAISLTSEQIDALWALGTEQPA